MHMPGKSNIACFVRLRSSGRRIGQEPPKPEEIPYDGRTLYERLQINEVGRAGQL